MRYTQVFAVVAVAVVLGGGIWWWANTSTSELLFQQSGPALPVQGEEEFQEGFQAVIVYTDEGFSPLETTIVQGDTVVWKNESSGELRPASAVHPTHTSYPGTSIQKCGTTEQENIFDACRPLARGETWSFRFLERGSWKFHNHFFPTRTGTVNVK